jgi:hypothetical protein
MRQVENVLKGRRPNCEANPAPRIRYPGLRRAYHHEETAPVASRGYCPVREGIKRA